MPVLLIAKQALPSTMDGQEEAISSLILEAFH